MTLVRPFQSGDVTSACRLTNHYIENTAIHFATIPASESEFRAGWEESTYPWLTAELDGAFVGYAKGSAWRVRAAYAKTVETGIYVEPSAHRRGVGRTLYAALLDALRTSGFHAAIGGIALPNDPSVRLHERLGFQPCGTFREVGHKFGSWHDVGFWQLLL